MLKIADNLSLPKDVVTQKLAFLGRTGSGKTYAASKLAEEMIEVGAQVVILDCVGVWYGLRLAADGKQPGISIPVFGGLHGDIPLEYTGGALVANLIVDRGISVVLDVSQFESDAHKARFGQEWADRFFFRKKAAPSAIHIFIEECQEFVPQNPMKGEERMLHAFQRIEKLGRNFGIGVSLISQRPQEINKKALNQTECLFAFQMTGPQERKAIEAWVSEKGVNEDIGDTLPQLQVGEAHVWSPQWLRTSKTVRVNEKRTFNASSTPTVGKQATARHLAPIDLERISADMATTIEKAKAEDPRELQKQIRELNAKIKDMARHMEGPAKPDPDALKREFDRGAQSVKVALAKELREHGKATGRILQIVGGMSATIQTLAADWAKLLVGVQVPAMPSLEAIIEQVKAEPARAPMAMAAAVSRPAPAPRPVRQPREVTQSNGSLGKSGLRRMLVALAQRPQGLSAKQLGTRAGISSKSGTFDTYLARGRTNGWLEGDRNRLVITEEGIQALGHYEPLPEGPELLEYWLGKLGNSGASRMLRVLAGSEKPMTAQDLGEQAQISSQSGTFDTYLARLRSLELVVGERNNLCASEELF